MKLISGVFALVAVLGITVHAYHFRDLNPTHATFSAFTYAPHGTILQVHRIVSFGPCVTVEFREIDTPGIHLQVFADYDEHISIPVLNEEFQYIDAVNQFGDPVSAVFLWQGKTFGSVPCPIQYIVAPPSTVLYEAPGAQPLINTSNRAEVSENNPAIAGFVLTESTWVIIRGIGPSMKLESGYINDPVITLHADQYLLDDFTDDLENSISNDNWQDTLRSDTLEYWEIAPENENESALVTYLHPGPYTVHLTVKGESGSGLVEVYIAPYSLSLE